MTSSPTTENRSISRSGFGVCWAIAAAFGIAVSAFPAQAQLGQYSDGAVTIDLSAIPGAGYAPAPGAGPAAAPVYGGLLDPGLRPPASAIYVQPQNAPKIQRPRTVRRSAPAPRMAEPKIEPVAKPAPRTVVEAAPPAPAAKAPEPLEAAPPPPPAPAATADATPPAPPAAPAAAPAPPASSTPSAPPPPAPVASSPPPAAPPPPPPVKVAPEPTPPPAPEATAALTPGADGRLLRVEFSEGQSKLPDQAKPNLSKLAEQVKEKRDVRLQLLAYAGGEGLKSNRARRLSLSRALSVRSFLIESGIRSTRIDVRALGDKTSDDPKNRVDVTLAKQ